MILPAAGLDRPWSLEHRENVQVLRLRAPRTKDLNYAHRTLAEMCMPFAMIKNLRQSPLAETRWDGVIWYSPSIFLGPVANVLKKASNCNSYLIVRDIFPEWAVDMGLMGRGALYWFFKAVAQYQYLVADTIGVQSPGNLEFFKKWKDRGFGRLEVLQNWLADAPVCGCSINLTGTTLSDRKIFVYAGNMGVAQGMDILLELADSFRGRQDIGFVFVGRGSDASRLVTNARTRGLQNVLFFDEIEPQQIPGLLAQCQAGIVALDPRHKTHNIPGKFLTYMQSGLPVLATVNNGNDLVKLIRTEDVGRACTDNSVATLHGLAEDLLLQLERDLEMRGRCKQLFGRLFSPAAATNQILAALKM